MQAETLTVYDAVYQQLALRLGADLASLDADLERASGRTGITMLPFTGSGQRA